MNTTENLKTKIFSALNKLIEAGEYGPFTDHPESCFLLISGLLTLLLSLDPSKNEPNDNILILSRSLIS